MPKRSPSLSSRARQLVLAAVILLPIVAEAQAFGRNKVLWERFEFVVLETEHFEIHYYPPDAPAGDYAARLAERWYARLSRFFDHELEEKIPVIIYEDHADFQQTTVSSGLIGEGTGGFTESVRNRVVLPLTSINADNDHVIGHELVHAFQFHMLKERGRETAQAQPTQIPLWVVEGLAEYLSEGSLDAATAIWMRDAVLHERFPDPEKFFQLQLSPYQYGQALWAYIAGELSDEGAREFFLRAVAEGVDGAIDAAFEQTRPAFFRQFHETLGAAYRPILDGRRSAADAARPLLTSATTGTSINYAPSLSPDGRWIAYLSMAELDIELYLADAVTGQVVRKLVSSERDPHFDYLSYLDSSAAWSPDGTRLAFPVFADGERRIAIYDVERDRIERRIDLPGIGGMRDPAWSPDGNRLAFSAMADGASDLYIVDLATDEPTRLTDDGYTAIQPSFSPQGTEIVFVTDRGPATDLELQLYGPLQLAILRLDDRSIEALSIFERGKHIDPHFSADGSSLYFVGEPDGVADLIRYDRRTGRAFRLTRLKTGVTGITAHSPAISVATEPGTLAFSVLEDGGWNIYSMEPGLEAQEVAADAGQAAARLPPMRDAAGGGLVDAYLAAGGPDLTDPSRLPRRLYEPKVRLAHIGPAEFSVGSGVSGIQTSSALSLYFDDMLNRHQIATTVQMGGTYGGILDFEDTLGLDVVYLNQERRFNWGARGSRYSYLRTATFVEIDDVEIDGSTVPARIYDRLLQVVTETEIAGVGQYPFSVNDRFEVTLGLSDIAFENELERIVYPEGSPAFREELGLPSPAPVDLRQSGLAFVRDTSRFGHVSPAHGTRFRIETQWTGGDLSFRTTLVDYRRYFLREPFTIALRALHVGRRGRDAESPLLAPYDVGRASLVRGYEYESFDLSECTVVSELLPCPELDRLLGSRIGVVNFELRLALLGTRDFGVVDVPAAPTEVAFFIDVGAAWSAGESVQLEFERDTVERVPVVSAGITLRSIVLGMLPVELYYAHPFQRPREDSVIGLRIGTAW